MQKQNIYICCGLPGSGKSTWSKQFVLNNVNTVIVNRDAFRSMFNGKYIYNVSLEPLVKDAAKQTFISCLNKYCNVVIDETNFLNRLRKDWLNIIENHDMGRDNFNVIAVVFSEMTNNVKNRMNDSRGICHDEWKSVITGMKNNFERVHIEEGFDSIVHIPFDKACLGLLSNT
jgi:tRNA uridine 5-carbamoylmethylation protein Kti12